MANGNQSGFGTPGTQQAAQKNVQTGGVSPNMPVGQQLAKHGASSYQQSLVPGAPTEGVKFAQAAFPGPSPAPIAPTPSPLAGIPYKEALGMNASMGFSNVAPAAMPSAYGVDLESSWMAGEYTPVEPKEDPDVDLGSFGSPTDTPQGPGGWAGEPSDEPGEPPNFGPLTGVPVDYDTEGAAREYWQTYHETHPGEAQEDVVGIDPETMEEIEQDYIEHAEMAIQEGLAALSRQYANMGMGGSGAHMVANNALVADVYKQLQDQMNALKTMDLEQQEIDMQEKIDNARNLYLDESMTTAQKVSSFAEIMGVGDSAIVQSYIAALEDEGAIFTVGQFEKVISALIQIAQSGGEDTSLMDQLYEVDLGEEIPSEQKDAFFTYLEEELYGKDFMSGEGEIGGMSHAQISAHVADDGNIPQHIWDQMKDKAMELGLSRIDVTNFYGTWRAPYAGGGTDNLGNDYTEDAWG